MNKLTELRNNPRKIGAFTLVGGVILTIGGPSLPFDLLFRGIVSLAGPIMIAVGIKFIDFFPGSLLKNGILAVALIAIALQIGEYTRFNGWLPTWR